LCSRDGIPVRWNLYSICRGKWRLESL
jgi:hypothetical protein